MAYALLSNLGDEIVYL